MRASFRPPAVPLITVDPFFSIWSFADTLPGDVTRHWTGTPHSLLGLVRIDGQPYRFLGQEHEDADSKNGLLPQLPQTGLEVTATHSVYRFAAAGIHMTVEFLAPILMDDLDVASRPVNYLSVQACSLDGHAHTLEIYLDITGSLCCDQIEQAETAGETVRFAGLTGAWLTNRKADQPLTRSGDHQRINWGKAYLLTPDASTSTCVTGSRIRQLFTATGRVDEADPDQGKLWAEPREQLVASVSQTLQVYAACGSPKALFLLAYEDDVSIDYFGRATPAYCFRDGLSFRSVLQAAVADYDRLERRCASFDARLEAESEQAGGTAYASLTALAYRQAFAAHKLIADEQGHVIFLSKECFSNGCIGTVDVSYPSIPLFLLYNPELVRGMLRPVFRFARSAAWPFEFAPHDVGQYPLATGQVYGLKEGRYDIRYQMPVEECGNMLIMTAAVCKADGDYSLALQEIDLLRKWAAYLEQYGQDPGEQLCTDDFAGHLAHNANLAVKAIVGLAAYAQILAHCGDKDETGRVQGTARKMAAGWWQMAMTSEHTVLVFGQADSWSMKYNLLFDRLLQLSLFPSALSQRDVAYWISRQNRYGLPLDSRATYSKADWLVWCVALCDDPVKVRAMLRPLLRFYHESGSRVPMTDWYDTVTGQAIHFRNRSVMGGVFALLLKAKWLQ